MALNLKLRRGQRGAVIGMTGTGKSTLSRELIPRTGKLAIVDPKREFDFPGVPVYDNIRTIWRDKPERIIYRPKPGDMGDLNALSEVYRFCYENSTLDDGYFVYTDDIVGICDQHRAPLYLKICYMMGRSKGITMIASFQRPSLLPVYLMSESSKFYIFELVMPNDVRKVAGFVAGYDPVRLADKHTFLYYDLQDKEQRRSIPVKLDISKKGA